MSVTLNYLDHFIYYKFFVLKIFLYCVCCDVAWCYEVKKGGLVYCGSVLTFTSHVLHYCSTADHPYQFFITAAAAAVTFWYGYQPHTTFSFCCLSYDSFIACSKTSPPESVLELPLSRYSILSFP